MAAEPAEVEDGLRPNIRIEIHNNLSENMEIDVDESSQKSDNEEGEISDENEVLDSTPKPDDTSTKQWSSTKAIFTTGINIFDKEEQEKLQERARRFALKPEEIHIFTDEDLQQLHESLGVTSENENEVRFDAVHMLGIKDMSIEDILEYFVKYAPHEIEWVSEDSCNIIWLENVSAARAMHYNSKYVMGMPVRVPSNPFVREFLDEVEEPEKGTGESILLKNKNREVELKADDGFLESQKKKPPKNSVDISEITIPVPPGYWRQGQKHPKSKCILLRYALKIDKQPFKTESLLKYYKKVSIKNVISESKKKEIRSIFERNKDFSQDKNPWGSLARNWDKDAKFREREPVIPVEDQKIEIKNPKILARLGIKRVNDEAEDGEAEIVEVNDKQIQERKKLKVPRMRMYADEEEEKLKRKKVLQSLKQQTEKITKDDNRRDLRSVLGIARRPIIEDKLAELDDTADLGIRLKNRSKNMIFALEHDIYREADIASIEDAMESKERVQEDIRELLSARSKYRDRSPIQRHQIGHRISPPSSVRRERSNSRERSIERRRRRRSIERRYHENSSTRRHQSPERTLHSDRMTYSSNRMQQHSRRHRSHSHERSRYTTKPKSKVAVVIKTQKKPAVASTVWSRVNKPSDSEQSSSESESESESEKSSSSSSESESEGSESGSSTDNATRSSLHLRPGFDNIKSTVIDKMDHRSPLKITMTNEHFKK